MTLLMCLATNSFADEPDPPAPSKPDGAIGGYEYVDLGLPSGTLWATCNIGATTPYESGDCFAWGELESKENYTWENYRYFIKHHYDPENGTWAILEDIGNNICGTEYDAAQYQWGNGWRLPNDEERYELRMLCWNRWTTENGVNGCRIYGPNEHSIFLPITSGGLWYGSPDPFDGEDGGYWTGVDESQNGYNGQPIEPSNKAKVIFVQYGGLQTSSSIKSYFNHIRAVVNPNLSSIGKIKSNDCNVTLIYRKGYIHILGYNSNGHITVRDMSGRKVYSGAIMNSACHLPQLSAGIYLVSYSDNGNAVTTQKIAIK